MMPDETRLPGVASEDLSDAAINILVAPGGYGKSWRLQRASLGLTGPVLKLGPVDGFSDRWFEHMLAACREANLPAPDPKQPRQWARDLGKLPLTVFLDDYEQLETMAPVAAFWQELLTEPPKGLHLWLASRVAPRLPLARLIAAGGRYLDRPDLSWSEANFKVHLAQLSLSWSEADADFWRSVAGWPLGLLLYGRRRAGALSDAVFESLLQEALQDWLPPFVSDLSGLWQPELQARLREWQADPPHWLPLLAMRLERSGRSEPAYWLGRATAEQSGLSPDQSRVHLERALSLCLPHQRALRLSALTRLAHTASLLGDWQLLDHCLTQGAELLEDGQVVDVAAWQYLSANRARQCCRYPEANQFLDALLALPAKHPAVMNFQVRARILRGLTAYQQGDYALTRRAYSDALCLAEADGKTQMQLELQIMLAFLDALLGQADEALAADTFSQVEALPLSAQPLVWLNLAFYQLLGEHLDLRQGQLILDRVRASALSLGWRALDPLIADVEARLWRFHQDYDRAERMHTLALAALDPLTFDWLYASLNQALTFLRRRRVAEARPLLEAVCARANETGSLGLLHEAMAALQSISPMSTQSVQPAQPAQLTYPKRDLARLPQATGDEPRLEIQCFGSFQLRLDGVAIERWPRKRAKHLLIQLLLHPHGIHRETLADWLTGSDELEAALRGLDVHIHALRKLLEPERKGKQASRYIRFHDAVYSFNWDCHYRWDVEGFAQAHQRWLRQRDEFPAEAEKAVNDALALVSGPFLPELDFADEWLAERESYARKAGDLALWSLEHLSGLAAYEQAEERAELLLRWDNLSEPGFAWLLRLAGQLRDRVRLERLGERMEQTFEKELGCPPPKELLQLYRAQLLMVN